MGGQAPHPRLAATEPFYRRGVQTNQLLHDVNELRSPSRRRRILNSGRLRCMSNGGADRDRTGDLKLAKLALSQLSYGPFSGGSNRGSEVRSQKSEVRSQKSEVRNQKSGTPNYIDGPTSLAA